MTAVSSVNPATGRSTANAAWSNSRMGIFVLDHPDPARIEFDAVILRDAIVCGVHLNHEATRMDIGERSFQGYATDMNMFLVPRGERLQFSTSMAAGLRSVTIVIDIDSMQHFYGAEWSGLPQDLRKAVEARRPMMERLRPGMFGKLAHEVAAPSTRPPAIPSLYYEGKAYELTSALLAQIADRQQCAARTDAVDRHMLAGVERAKAMIDARPAAPLDIDRLALGAAMNRTKLRAAFKLVYGKTLTEYRTAAVLRLADERLRTTGGSVQDVAYRAGYANASSFIVAYKRHFGFSPGLGRAGAAHGRDDT